MRQILALVALAGLGLLAGPPAEAQRGSWSRLDIPELGSTIDLYVPRGAVISAAAAASEGAGAVVFLHATGREPESYRGTLGEAAESLDVVLLLPRATTPFGWGFEDDLALIESSLALVRSIVPLDPVKIAIAGHGEGAGYAYLLAYVSDLELSAVLTLGAPFLPISELFAPERPAPVRMIYGAEDPLYRSDGGRLREQWSTLGIDWQVDVLPDFGHSTWPQETILEGFRFLVERSTLPPDRRCSTSRTALCVGEGRFRAEVTFTGVHDRPGRGKVIADGTPDSGIFWFFDSDNWEVMVKVLDGCAVNDHFWVFAAASTDVDYRLTVTDQITGRVVQYAHERGSPARAVADVEAFGVCDPAP